VIETRTGLVDAKLSTQLEEIAAAMLDVRAGVEEGGEMDPVVTAALRALGRGVQAPAERPSLRPASVEAPARPARRLSAPAPQPAAPGPAASAPDPAAEAHALLEAARAEAAFLIAQAQAEVEARVAPASADPELPVRAVELQALITEALPAPEALFTDLVLESGGSALPPGGEPLAPTPAAAPVAPAAKIDPSKRAAQALAVRLGQMRAGRAVLSIEEELAIKDLERKERDLCASLQGTVHGWEDSLLKHFGALESYPSTHWVTTYIITFHIF
jgi:hypothetical protein